MIKRTFSFLLALLMALSLSSFALADSVEDDWNEDEFASFEDEEEGEKTPIRLSYCYYSGSAKNSYEEKMPQDEEKSCKFVVRSPEESISGYLFLGWSWSDGSASPDCQPGDEVTLEKNRTLYAVWESDGTEAFFDVSAGAFYYDAVQWAVENKITSGTGGGKFSPNASCTRSQAVTFLWRAAGEPEPQSTENPFTDVKPGDFFYKAVLWAKERKITSGTSATKFSPDDRCTRGQIVTFQYRAAGTPGSGGGSAFSDVSSSSYCYDAVKWAVANGITQGSGNGKFSPDDTCNRGQIVTFLYRAR